ncbi:MAG: TRAP transporter permease [Alphaproteobacteria bacterium]|nr:TRAP transporter permease [Alphaproteobacteria bacterium]
MAREHDAGERGGPAELERLVAESDLGGRRPGGLVALLLSALAITWALFQLWYASPLPFAFNFFILNDTEARAIHLAFAVSLAFLAFPAGRRAPRGYVPLYDWILAIAGAAAASYLFVFYRELATRPGLPSTLDLVGAAVGLVLLLEAARRTVGPALVAIACLFMTYIFVGPHLPEMIAHKGASFSRAMSQLWLTTEGVFGVALGVSTSFVFLFVLFGSLLDRAGAGNYFIKLSFAALGHLRGGPAKAAVVSSGMTGIISGSSIANVVTTGTFTIPLMKRVGYPGYKAGAIETAASVNGQIMPPVMGAAAFLIAEYVGIPYAQVVKHAFLPAIITYIALFYVVDLEAVKLGLTGLRRDRQARFSALVFSVASTMAGIVLLSAGVYWGIGWLKTLLGGAAIWVVSAIVLAIYIGLIANRARHPDLEPDDPDGELKLPEFNAVARTGLHYLLPVVLLIWCLMVEHLSPGLSAFWATMFMIFVLVTQRPLTAAFRRAGGVAVELRAGFADLRQGLEAGARNMIGVGIATATAGVVVGTVTLTGIGLIMTEVVDFLSAGNIFLMLILTAAICIILGMGMPTTASYVVVATLMAPVVVELAGQHDLAVPLIAVHLFVFYFGLMADVTPPVGLASYAASAIARADPIRTGFQSFRYEIRTGLLPFIFIFNNELLLIDVASIWHAALVALASLAAMLLFVAATQGHFLVKSRWYETAALLLVCFTLFRPGFWMDMIQPPYEERPASEVYAIAEAQPANGFIRLRASGETLRGEEVTKTIKLPLAAPGAGKARIESTGVVLGEEGGVPVVEDIRFRSVAQRLGLDLDWRIEAVEVPTERLSKHWMFLPALALATIVLLLQHRRRKAAAASV